MAPVLRPRPTPRSPNAVSQQFRRYRANPPKPSAANPNPPDPPAAAAAVVPDCCSITISDEEKDDTDATKKEKERPVITDCGYWRELCNHLDALARFPDTAPRLELPCTICQTAVLRLPDAAMSNREGKDVDDLTVAPCGHVFGAKCLYEWLETKYHAGELPVCPACRFPLLHQGCKHYISVRTFEAPDDNGGILGLKSQVPVPVPQGGVVARDCRHCREKFVRGSMMGMLKLMLDNSHVTRDRMPPQVRQSTQMYLSEMVLRNTMNAYNIWAETNSEADEWI